MGNIENVNAAVQKRRQRAREKLVDGLLETGVPGPAAWGGITGTLADQTDLNSALAGKASSSHTHTASAITDFDAAVAATPAVTANTSKVSNANHTGDATGSTALTLATVNANVGSFGLAGSVAQFTVNAKGLITAAANVAISIAASAISDATTAGRNMLTAANVAAQTALLDVFTSSLKGLVPSSGGGTTNFLRADGTWAVPGGGSDPWTYLSLASNNTVSTTALADVTGMSFTGDANTTYEVEIFGAFQTAATTTGIGIAFNIPSGTVYGMTFAPSANTTAMITQNLADDTVLAPTTAVAAANTYYAIFGKFLIAVGGTGGTVQLRQRSEVAASNSILKAGLKMKYRTV